MVQRVYAVESEDELTLVKAGSQAQAINHVVKGKFTVRVASGVDVVDYIQAGGEVEDAAGGDPQAGEEGEKGEVGAEEL